MKAYKLAGKIAGKGFQLGALLNQSSQPSIADIAVSSITDTGFTIGANITANGASTVVTIEYGLTNAYGSEQETVTGSPVAESGAISAALSGLAQNTTYHYRIKAVNSAGTTYSDDATQATTNVRWVLPVTGRTSGTPTAGTMTINLTEDETITSTGDVTVSIVQASVTGGRRHTVTVNCPNNGSGTIIIPDKTKVRTLGQSNGILINPHGVFYSGVDATAPILSLNINEIPPLVTSIHQDTAYANIIPITGNSALPSGLFFLALNGANIAWTYTGALPAGLTYLRLNGANIAWTYTGALPTGLTYLSIIGDTGNIKCTYSGALPTGLTYLYIRATGFDWTGLDIGNTGNLTNLTLENYRISKMSSADMVTLLTQLKDRTGSLPNTITINDYANYASPPTSVTDAVAALKAAKTNVTTVNLGA